MIILVLSVLVLIPSLTSASFTCQHHEYWDANLDECASCTKCSRHEIAVRPCQRHIDTVCRPINSIEIDWSKSMAEERHHRNKQHQFTNDGTELYGISPEAAASRDEQEILLWNWQLTFLVLAIIACCLFFLVTAFISINYIRQWRKIKKQFDTGE